MRTTPPVPRPPAARGAGMIAEVLGLALATLLLGAVDASARSWSLDQVIAVVRERDPGVGAARASADADRARAAGHWAMLAPQVTASAGFTRTDDPAVLFSQKLWQGRFEAADFAIDRLNQPGPRSALQVGIAVDQPLWNGGRELAAPALGAHYRRAATTMERAQIADRLLDAVEAYVDVVRAGGAARSAGLALDAASAMRGAAVERFRAGQAPELDTLRALARHSEARVRLASARQGLAVAADRLSRLVQAPVEPESLVVADDPGAEPEAPAGGRGELAAAREGAAAARTESRLAALRLLPSLNSHLAVTQYRPYDTGRYRPRWLVALSADFPVFDGARRLNEWRAARARADAAQATAQQVERDLAIGLHAARIETSVARERREAARAGRAAAEETLRFATLRYRAGLLPLTDLLATDAEASASRASDTEASTEVTLAHYRLLHAMGELR